MNGFKSILIIILFFFSFFNIHSESLDTLLTTTIEEMHQTDGQPLHVGLGVFHFEEKSIGGNFSYFLENKFSIALNRSPYFELVDRDNLDSILEETRFGLTGLVEEKSRIEPGKLKGLQAILSGRYYDNDNSVRLFVDLLSLQSGTILSTKEIVIPKSMIPGQIRILPDNYHDAISLLDELATADRQDKGFLAVKAWTKRGNGGTYHNGENLVINFYSNNDCYIKIYHIDVDGKINLIFPNHIYSDNFITANRIYKIPDSRYNFNFELSPPYGTEFVKVIASVNQFQFIENSFEDLDIISEQIVSKGLQVTPKENQSSELVISYTIIE